jgi:hypothetical protein
MSASKPGKSKTKKQPPLQIALSEQPAPPIAGYADRCAVLDQGSACDLVFYQAAEGEPDVVVRLSVAIDACVAHLWGSSGEFYAVAREDLEKTEFGITPVDVDVPVGNMPRAVSCNLFGVYRAGSIEAVLDCYYLSPRDLHFARVGGKPPQVEPVVRVQLPLPVLIGLLAHIEAQAEILRGRLGKFAPPI